MKLYALEKQKCAILHGNYRAKDFEENMLPGDDIKVFVENKNQVAFSLLNQFINYLI